MKEHTMNIVSSSKSAKFVTVTPALASKWLEGNTDNRAKRGRYIFDMAAAMRRGEWQATHQGIAFAKSGRLIDGQHRLEALIKADSSLDMLVVVGMEESTFSVIDVGSGRNFSDITRLSKRTAETCRFLAKIESGCSKPTAAQVTKLAEHGTGKMHDSLIEYCASTRAFYASSAMRSAAVTLVLNGYDKDTVFQNYTNLVLEKFSSMNNLSQELTRLVNAKKVGNASSYSTYDYGLQVLSPDGLHKKTLRQTNEDISASIQYAKATMKRTLS